MAEKTRLRVATRVIAWLWTILALIIAAEFLLNAVQKLAGMPAALAPFVEFGWPMWMVVPVSIVEILGSVALVIPVTRTLGGLLLTVIMIGAAFTNIANGHPDYVWVNAALIAGSLLLAWEGRTYLRRHWRRYRRP